MAGNNPCLPEPIMKTWERNVGTVHVNPNFNKPTTLNPQALSNNSLMHINPKFSHLLPNLHTNNLLNKTKIYVNPNFIRPQNAVETNCRADSKIINCRENIKEQIPAQNAAPVATSMSRYSLVRHNEHKVNTSVPAKITNTVKLGKYKSVQVNYIKKTLEVVKCGNDYTKQREPARPSSQPVMHKASGTLPNTYESRFKIIKQNGLTIHNNAFKSLIVKRMPVRKQVKLVNQQVRIRINKGIFKKNNIPCPQFKKYGKCMRNEKGKCEFLHDMKHVSICRKFIKGLCHDAECLLSHELTAKKMPTCHFYLNGICTKENCPYLHVKLNEKSKTCADFLNGYCEKGTECLYRHINLHHSEVRIESSKRKLYSLRRKMQKFDGKVTKNKPKSVLQETVLTEAANTCNERISTSEKNESKEPADRRYYKAPINESSHNDSQCAVIKPTRCKLGPLPSYIQI